MHPDSMRLMGEMKRRYLGDETGQLICDDGGACNSPDKSYRRLFPQAKGYVVYDIVPHPSVDFVKRGPFEINAADQTFDLVVSGQMLEHCQNPFRAVAEMKRVLKVGGHIVIIVPSAGRRHDAQDGWRFMDDAFKFIALEVGGFDTLCDFIDKSGTEAGRGAHWKDHVWCARRVA